LSFLLFVIIGIESFKIDIGFAQSLDTIELSDGLTYRYFLTVLENSDDTESTENVSLEHNSGKAKIILTGHKYSERNDCLILTFLILIFTITVKL